MNFDTTANLEANGTSIRIIDEALLIERLQWFGLIEASGDGGWRLTDCCQAGLAALESETKAPSNAGRRPSYRGSRASSEHSRNRRIASTEASSRRSGAIWHT